MSCLTKKKGGNRENSERVYDGSFVITLGSFGNHGIIDEASQTQPSRSQAIIGEEKEATSDPIQNEEEEVEKESSESQPLRRSER